MSAQPKAEARQPRLQKHYREAAVPALMKQLGITNPMQVPRIEKITVNMGVGEAVADKKLMDAAVADLTKITGQKPLLCKSRKSIAAFKLRAGLVIGAKVTLRGPRMYDFLDRLVSIAMPRIRDFRGVSPRCFDGHGNYTLGVSDQSIFPEVELDKIKRNIGFDVTIVTTAGTNEEAKSLLSEMGLPFSDRAKKPVAQATNK